MTEMILTDDEKTEIFNWLDQIREGGSISMLGAAPYVADMFGLDKNTARAVTMEWMETFATRHPEG